MKLADGKVMFGEWLPDLPDLANPGLIEAKNVLPLDRTYKSFPTFSASGTAGPSRPLGAYRPVSALMATLYVGFDTSLRINVGGTWTDKSGTAYNSSAAYWRFAEYKGAVIATNLFDIPQRHVVGAGGNFGNLHVTGTAPKAQHVGVIGQFVMLGNTDDSTNGAVTYRVQWCGIDDETDWPTPGTSDAVTVQAGEQFLRAELGEVTGIFGNDQNGVILQQGGVTRATYQGGTTVFQFDTIESGRGNFFPNSAVQVGGLVFFIADSGFCVTDGVTVSPIGDGKASRYFLSQANFGFKDLVYGAADYESNLIYWGYAKASSGNGRIEALIIYNYLEKRFSYAEDVCQVLIGIPQSSSAFAITAFNTSHQIGAFNGSPGTAVLTTGDVEGNLGGRTHVQGVKPLVSGASTVTATVALGARDALDAAVTYTSESTPHARTGFAGFRSDARYHRARTTITGAFEKAMGIEFQQVPSGAA